MSTTPFSFGLQKTTSATTTTSTGFTFGKFNNASSSNTTGTSLFGVPSISATPAVGAGLQPSKPTMTAFGAPGFNLPATATAINNNTNATIGLPAASSTVSTQSNLFGFNAANSAAVTAKPVNPQLTFGLSSPAVTASGAATTTVAPNQPVFRLPATAGTIQSTTQGTGLPSGGVFSSFSPQQAKPTSGAINTATPSFGAPVATASTTTTNQVQLAFGQPSLSALTGGKTTVTTTSTTPLNFGFANPQATQPAIVSTTTSTSGGFQFPQPSSAASTTTAAMPTSGTALKFGVSSTIGTSTGTVPTVTTTTPNVTSTTLPTTSLGALGTSASSTSVSSVPTKLPTTMTYNQLEELINKWTHELDEQERYFSDEATRVNSWDQALLANSEKIASLYEKVEACKRDQTQLEQEFELIESQQRELEGLLEVVEKASNDLVPRSQLHSDFEREALLQTASNVDLELGQLLTDLKEMANQVNATADGEGVILVKSESTSEEKQGEAKGNSGPNSLLADSGPGPTAVQQVTRIINCHLQSLNWIHQNSQDLMERIKTLESA